MKREITLGTKFKVHGFIMLKGLDNGNEYQVTKIDDISYTCKRVLNNKSLSNKSVRHYINSVNSSINDSNLNHIELI